jgi:hypothetical protein
LQALVSEMERSGRLFRLVDALGDEPADGVAASAVEAAIRGGAARIMADLALRHSNPLVRQQLDLILAGRTHPVRQLADAIESEHQAARETTVFQAP